MKRRVFLLMLIVAFTIFSVCYAEEINDYDDLIEYGAQYLLVDSYTIRTRYCISMPVNTQKLHEEVVKAYDGYEKILLIEYGYSRIPPVVESQFVCVGVVNKTEISVLPTPFDLIARTYDLAVIEGVNISEVEIREEN